mgnify:CR=1 FL=1
MKSQHKILVLERLNEGTMEEVAGSPIIDGSRTAKPTVQAIVHGIELEWFRMKSYRRWLVDSQDHIWTPMPMRAICPSMLMHTLTHFEIKNESGSLLSTEKKKRVCACVMETEHHVTLECLAYKCIRHDFQEFCQGYGSFQELLSRTGPSLLTPGMLFACLLIHVTKFHENPNSDIQKQVRFLFQLLLIFLFYYRDGANLVTIVSSMRHVGPL